MERIGDGQAPGQRRAAVVVVACVALACLLAWLAPVDAMQRAGAERAAVLVDDLAALGGLQDAHGTVTARALPTQVTQEGGPLWVTPAVSSALEAHPAFALAPQAPNLIRAEIIADDTHLVMQGALYRQGWNLRLPAPLRIRVVPWIPMLALALGLAVFAWRRRAGWAVALAGVLAQCGAALWPWPSDVPVDGWLDAVREGPAGRLVMDAAKALPDSSMAVGAGVVTLCVVLMAFDHRRSSGVGGTLLLSGAAGVMGALAWIEVAGRCGLWAWIGTWAGAVAACAMALAWGLQARTLASLHRERPSATTLPSSTSPAAGSPPAQDAGDAAPEADAETSG